MMKQDGDKGEQVTKKEATTSTTKAPKKKDAGKKSSDEKKVRKRIKIVLDEVRADCNGSGPGILPPGVCLSKVLVTYWAQNQIFK